LLQLATLRIMVRSGVRPSYETEFAAIKAVAAKLAIGSAETRTRGGRRAP